MNAPGGGLRLDIAAVAFDLDGTLLDTAADLARAANLMMADLALPPCEADSVRAWIGNGVERLVKRCLTGDWQAEPEAALMARALPVFEAHYHRVYKDSSTAYPGVMEGLAAFAAAGLPMAVVTNKPSPYTLPLLEAAGMAHYFRSVVCGDQVARKKPDPLPFLMAARQLGVEPSRMLVVGDSANDVQGARDAGCPVYVVPYGYNGGRDPAELPADALVPDLLAAARLALGQT